MTNRDKGVANKFDLPDVVVTGDAVARPQSVRSIDQKGIIDESIQSHYPNLDQHTFWQLKP